MSLAWPPSTKASVGTCLYVTLVPGSMPIPMPPSPEELEVPRTWERSMVLGAVCALLHTHLLRCAQKLEPGVAAAWLLVPLSPWFLTH